MIGTKGWCPACRRMKVITDRHDEGTYADRLEYAFMVTEFECGHHSQSDPKIIGAGPGGESLSEAHAQHDMIRRQEAWDE